MYWLALQICMTHHTCRVFRFVMKSKKTIEFKEQAKTNHVKRQTKVQVSHSRCSLMGNPKYSQNFRLKNSI
jgi:hypothetical protein